MKYDETKWHYTRPKHDSFVYYIPVLRYNSRHLYGDPQRTRLLAHQWILDNLPVMEDSDYSQYVGNGNSNNKPNLEPETYVLHAGNDYAAYPRDIRSGKIEDWLNKVDSRWTITKRFDAKFYRALRQFFT